MAAATAWEYSYMNKEDEALFETGDDCWRISQADRVRFLVDGEHYFRAFRAAAEQAKQSILMLGWDFHSRFELVRDDSDDGLPSRLAEFLDALVQRRKTLKIHLLNWDYSIILAADREWGGEVRFRKKTHERVRFCRDAFHPVGASHHQKIVVIDDRLAFVGGLDFTRGRWDSREHTADDERRRDNGDESVPQPYHDFEIMVSGAVARDLGDLARERWHRATGERLQRPVDDAPNADWPQNFETHMRGVKTGIARTFPEHKTQNAVREIERSLLRMIQAAEDCIYIENQYFTTPAVCTALADRLAEREGPEVIVVLPKATVGWLSQTTMDVLRQRRLHELEQADQHGRLGVFYPHQTGLGDSCINLHSKIMIVDERAMSAGSANLNNRSMGLDSECNLLFDTANDADHRKGLASLRSDLLAEHLDVDPGEVDEAIAQTGSVKAAIGELAGQGRSLRRLDTGIDSETDALVPATDMADPEQPIDYDYLARQLELDEDGPAVSQGVWRLVGLVLMALLLAAAWRWTPLADWLDPERMAGFASGLEAGWAGLLITVAVYVVGGFLLVPVTLLIVATGLVFGSVWGFGYALLGAELSALSTYAVGQAVGRDAIRNLSGRWLSRVSRALGRQGLLAVITLRIVPVAPFTVVNLAAGASHIRWRDFALGTLLGLLPGTLALVVLSDRLMAAIRSPSLTEVAVFVVLLVLLGLGLWGVRRWARKRQDASGSDE